MDYLHKLTLAAEAMAEAAKEIESELDGMNPETVKPAKAAVTLFHIKEAYAALDAARKRVYHQLDRLDKNIVPQAIQNAGLDLIRIPEIGRSFSPRTQLSASLIDKERGFEWLREIGAPDLIQPTVNASSLSSLIRSMIKDEGIDPPDDIVRVNTYTITSINRYNPK